MSSRRRARTASTVVLAASVALAVAGCSQETQDTVARGWLPGTDETSSINPIVRSLWVGSWIAALVVGVLVWGLTLWCVVRYRRRRGATGLPPQLRYNVPIEVLYTVVPLFMVGVLFYYTARDQEAIENPDVEPTVNIEVVGKQWAWDFNYLDADVYETTTQVEMQSGRPADEVAASRPVLYLPVDQPAEITLRSRDVIHSFYVPAFNYKKDMIPGRTNYMRVTPGAIGEYEGRCAELCGEYHSAMLFVVRVVSQEDYDAHLAGLEQRGQTGALEVGLGPSDLAPDQSEDSIGQSGGEEGDQ